MAVAEESETIEFRDGLTRAFDTVENWGEDFYSILPNMIVGFVVLFIFGLMAYSVSRTIRLYFERKERIDLGNILSDFGFWAMMLAGCLISLTIIMPSLRPADLLASLGIGSIAIGFAFKDILQNWFSGLLILLRLPFRRGDQISLEGAEGTVIRIEPRATILRTYDGSDIVIPNTQIYSGMVTVHTSQPYRRVEMDLTVGYDYEVTRITEILQTALSDIDEIQKDPPAQVMCWELGATSLGIKLRWWIKSGRSNEVISRARAVHAIKAAFEANDIDPTDPQLVYYQSASNLPPEEEGEKVNNQDTKSGSRVSVQSEEIVPPPPPPKFSSAHDDPETEQPKEDAKAKTLLTDDNTLNAGQK